MRKVGLAVLALAVTGAAGAATIQKDVKGWLQERASAYESHLQAGGEPQRTAPLWRERPADAALPDFVPPTSLAPLIRLGYIRMLWMAIPYTITLTTTALLAITFLV